MQARHRLEAALLDAFLASEAYIQRGGKPRCVVDHWNVQLARATAGTVIQALPPQHWAAAVLDTLFAAQDATASALTWAMDVLERHPLAMAQCRTEVLRVLESRAQPMAAVFSQLEWAELTAKELLRYKSPVPMIPHVATADASLHGCPIVAGTVVVGV